MKKYSHSLFRIGLLSLCCSLPFVSPITSAAPPSEGIRLVPPAARSASFEKVASHLELGGTAFTYRDGNELTGLANILQVFLEIGLKTQRQSASGPDLSHLSIPTVFETLGLFSSTAHGGSAHRIGEGFHNRLFSYEPKGRKGILNLFGDEPEKFAMTELAPADASLVLEHDLYINTLVPLVNELMPQFGDANATKQWHDALEQPLNPQVPITLGDLLKQAKFRLGIILRLDDTKPVKLEQNLSIGYPDFLLTLNQGKLILKLAGDLPPSFPKEETEDHLNVQLPPLAPFMTEPTIIYLDKKADRLYLVSSAAFLKECQQSQGAIRKNAEFQQAFGEMPPDGNGMLFLSGKKLLSLVKTIAEATPPSDRQVLAMLIGRMSAFLDFPLGYVLRHEADGTLTLINSKLVLNESSVLTGLTTVSVLAGVAVPYFNHARTNAVQINEISHARQLFSGAEDLCHGPRWQISPHFEGTGDGEVSS